MAKMRDIDISLNGSRIWKRPVIWIARTWNESNRVQPFLYPQTPRKKYPSPLLVIIVLIGCMWLITAI